MALDLSSLEAATGELDAFLQLCRATNTDLTQKSVQARAYEAAAIQAFEFTYELCHKMLRRYLEATMPSAAGIASLNFSDLIRTGFGQGVVKSEWKTWSHFRNMRNVTSHTYDPKKAASVVAGLPEFLSEARYMLSRMQTVRAP